MGPRPLETLVRCPEMYWLTPKATNAEPLTPNRVLVRGFKTRIPDHLLPNNSVNFAIQSFAKCQMIGADPPRTRPKVHRIFALR